MQPVRKVQLDIMRGFLTAADLTLDMFRLFARLLDTLNHCSHRCVVFEMLGLSLQDAMHVPSLFPLPRRHLREISTQIIWALKCKLPPLALNQLIGY